MVNCANCGAAMALSARGHYICAHCGSVAAPGAVERDGIRIVGSADASRVCPACGTPLATAMVDEYQVSYCEHCGGMLIPRRSFAEVIRRRRAWAAGAAVTPTPPGSREMRRQVSCPQCHAAMTVDRYYGPGNIIMDSCAVCDLVWLDSGELKQVIDSPGPDRGTRELG
jgi:Zn-finger nucleic acid-binding protein